MALTLQLSHLRRFPVLGVSSPSTFDLEHWQRGHDRNRHKYRQYRLSFCGAADKVVTDDSIFLGCLGAGGWGKCFTGPIWSWSDFGFGNEGGLGTGFAFGSLALCYRRGCLCTKRFWNLGQRRGQRRQGFFRRRLWNAALDAQRHRGH